MPPQANGTISAGTSSPSTSNIIEPTNKSFHSKLLMFPLLATKVLTNFAFILESARCRLKSSMPSLIVDINITVVIGINIASGEMAVSYTFV